MNVQPISVAAGLWTRLESPLLTGSDPANTNHRGLPPAPAVMGVRPQIEMNTNAIIKCRSVNDLAIDSGIGAALLSVWIFVDQSGPKKPAGERPDTCRRQRAVEDSDALPRTGPGPAWPRRLRHQRHRRIGPHLSDE